MWVTRSGLLVCLLSVAAPASAVSKDELEQRVQQLERRIDSRGLVELMQTVEMLRADIQQLRGEIEIQNNSVESLQKRQRDLYMDVDRRLHRIETGGEELPADTAGSTPPGITNTVTGAAAGSAMMPSAGSSMSSVAASGATVLAPATPTAKPAAASDPEAERKAYNHALGILQDGRYPDAAVAFSGFLASYPDSSYTDNAQYWLGEVYYVSRKFREAQAEFDKVITQHPQSPKVPDAMLKTGFIQYELREWSAARKTLTELTQSYPGTTAARLAQERLDRMKREKH